MSHANDDRLDLSADKGTSRRVFDCKTWQARVDMIVREACWLVRKETGSKYFRQILNAEMPRLAKLSFLLLTSANLDWTAFASMSVVPLERIYERIAQRFYKMGLHCEDPLAAGMFDELETASDLYWGEFYKLWEQPRHAATPSLPNLRH